MGVVTATCLVVASMIGTGVFTTSGYLIADLHTPLAIVVCWLVAGVAALFGAWSYAELGAAFAESGGEYWFLSRLFHPVAGFLSAVVSLLVGFAAPLAAIAIAFGEYLNAVGVTLPARVSGGILLLASSLLHGWRVGVGTGVQNLLTVAKVVLVAGFALLGAAQVDWTPLTAASAGPSALTSGGFAVGLLSVSFAYTGWNASAYVAGEIREPGRVLPRALTVGTLLVTALYVGLNAVFVSALPLSRLRGELRVGHLVAEALWGAEAARAGSAIIALGVVSTVGAMVVTGPRVYEAVGRDYRKLRWLTRRTRGGGPWAAVALQTVLAFAMMFSARFDQLLVYIGFTLSLFSALAVAGVFKLRRTGRALPFRTPGYPVTPALYILLMAWMAIRGLQERPAAALAGIVTLLLGALAYAWVARPERSA